MNDTEEKILDCIIGCQLATYTSLYAPGTAVVTISDIVALCDNITKYKARKALKELISDGLIYYTSQGCPVAVSYGEYPEIVEDARPPRIRNVSNKIQRMGRRHEKVGRRI